MEHAIKKILPSRLNVGDTICILSPASGIAPFAMHRIENGKKELEDMGFNVVFGEHALNNAEYVSDSIKNRVADLHAAFLSNSVKAIICSIGGNHSNQLLPHIDWEIIKNNPKIFVGYSDITVLHLSIQKMTGLTTYYGPCLMSEFGEYPNVNEFTKCNFLKEVLFNESRDLPVSLEFTEEYLEWFTKEDLKRPRRYNLNNSIAWWRNGTAAGELIGGCIPSLNHLLGTKYSPEYKDKILFIEFPEGRTMGQKMSFSDIDAYCADLYNANIFSEIAGLIIGRPYGYNNNEEDIEKLKTLLFKYLEKYDFPIVFNVDIGHTSPMLTLAISDVYEISSQKNLIKKLNNITKI